MTRLVLREVARWARAVALPAVAVVALVVLQTFAPRLIGAPPRVLVLAWAAALGTSALWLAVSIARAAIQPYRDRRAAQHLQDLRVRAGLPDHELLCVLRVLWGSPAGQLVAAVNVRTGTTVEVWLSESRVADGAYALVAFRHGAGTLLDTATATAVLAAKRHESRRAPRRTDPGDSAHATRRDRRAAAEVIRAAEALLDGR